MNTRLIPVWLLALGIVLPAQAGTLGGTVFEDWNRSGLRDPGEPALAGVPVLLMGSGGAVVRATRSASDGSFEFGDLPDGDYVFSVPERGDLRASPPDTTAEPPPISGFPFGLPRYTALGGIVSNLYRATGGARTFRHVALGDSIGFGFNVCGSFLGGNGYIEPTTNRLRRATSAPVLLDKQAVPGDQTRALLRPGLDLPLLLHNDVAYAVDTNAALVSISIGGNDFLAADRGGDPSLAAGLVAARRNIQEILSGLVSGLPLADVEINTVYDNQEGADPLTNLWAPIWNQMMREAAWGQARRVTVAEIYPEYAHASEGGILGQPGLICNVPFDLDGIHPTNLGYDVHEEKLWQSFGGVTLAGDDRGDIQLGFLRLAGRRAPSRADVMAGSVLAPGRSRQPDGIGALVAADAAELRVSGFLDGPLPGGLELTQAVVKVRYRTTGAPLDDHYRFEASLDGTFSPPGSTPATWNTILPLVGASGDESDFLVFPDQPEWRIVSAPLYLGSPVSSAGTLRWADLRTLAVRLVTIPEGTPDGHAVEWDAAWIEGSVRPSTGPASVDPQAVLRGGTESQRLDLLLRRAARDPAAARGLVRRHLDAGGPASWAVLALLAELGEPVDASRARPFLLHPDPVIRAFALRGLASLEGPSSLDDLRPAEGDPDPGVRRTLARAVCGIPGPDAARVLIRMGSDPDAGVRQIAARGMARSSSGGAALAVLVHDPVPRVRVEAAASLLELGDDSGVEVLIESLGGPGASSRARRALADRPEARPGLLRALSAGEPGMRAIAARLLGAGAGEALPELRALLGDLDPGVRASAMHSLSRSGDRASIGRIASLWQVPVLQVDVAQALGRLGGPEAWDTLARLALASDARPTARRLAARGLAQGSAEVRPHLVRLIHSDDLRIRRLAAAGLARLAGRQAAGG